MPHECIVRCERDPFAEGHAQWLVGCQCHMGQRVQIWRWGDAPVLCPVSGDDLTAGIANGEEVGGGRA